MLESVRKRRLGRSIRPRIWRLEEDTDRAKVLQHLLKSGGATFVQRGEGGIKKACDSAEDLIERRDLALLKTNSRLRPGAISDATIKTSEGDQPVAELLESIVSNPKASHEAERP